MIKLGDKVRFINENMQGTVTSIKGNTAGVTIEDDFEIPVLLSDIVKINDILNRPKTEDEKPITVKPKFVKVHSGFHVAFDGINENTVELKFHNSETDWAMLAVYHNNVLSQKFFVELESTQILGRYKLDEFNTWPEFTFVITPLADEFKPYPNTTRTIKFRAKEFHASFKQCYFLGKQAYTFRLDSDVKAAHLNQLVNHDFSAKSPNSTSNKSLINLSDKPQNPVDLHIEQLVENPALLSAQEMIDEQMKAVAKTIEMGHVHKLKTLTIIHGVGNNFLKNKIKNYLNTQKEVVAKYADADMLKYGGGATEVWFK